MPILRHRLWYALLKEEPDSTASQNQPEHGNQRDAQVEEAWRQIESEPAQRAPTFDIAAERLELRGLE